MSPQEIFDVSAIHLFVQGKRAQDEKFVNCISDDGSMCPVGLLIGEDYFPELESNRTLRWLIENHTDMFPDWFIENVGLISGLQSIHDKQRNWEDIDIMKSSLESLAEEYNLKTYILDDFEKFGNGENNGE